MPNLDILDIGALAVTSADFVIVTINAPSSVLYDLHASVFRCTAEDFAWRFSLTQPYLFRNNDIDINNMNMNINMNMNMNKLREIHLDPFGMYLHGRSLPIAAYCQEYSELEQEEWFADASHNYGGLDWVLLQEYPNLERVTLKHAEYKADDNN